MDLTSAPVPALQADDHVRGPRAAPLVVMYADFACPHCAVAHARIQEAEQRHGPLRVVFRHFALKAKHPRGPALAAAAEAAALQGAFWPFHDGLYADQGRQADPHLWQRAEELGLDVGRFDDDRRSDAVAARVKRDVHAAMRAGVVTTPTLVLGGELHAGPPSAARLLDVRNDEKHEGVTDPTGGPGKDNFI
jgi:protein-disulfide isomerase